MQPLIIIANLHNSKTGRYHPIAFRLSPAPSGDLESCARYKSIGHHTEGFDTRQASLDECNGKIKEFYTDSVVNVEKDFHWDGESVPAMVVWFTPQGVPAL